MNSTPGRMPNSRERSQEARPQIAHEAKHVTCGRRYTTLLDSVGDVITHSWLRGISERSLAVTYQMQRESVEGVVRDGIRRRFNRPTAA